TATFETPDEDIVVGSGELIRFAPGEYQKGYNNPDEGDGTVVAFALGAPGASHDWDELESLVPCAECGEEKPHGVELVDGAFELTCTDCGSSFSIGG
ncbi:MAG: cupin, partial [Halobacteriales archaeon]